MAIPNAKNAIVSREKVHDYLLNLDHPDGGSKAIWFYNLGYERSKWQIPAEDLLKIANSCNHFDTIRSPYGVKYIASGMLSRPDHRPGRVVTAWIVEDDFPPRLITAYPDDSR